MKAGERFVDIGESNEWRLQAARVLVRAFAHLGSEAWPDMESAGTEVEECLAPSYLSVGLAEGSRLLGWVGLRPMYEATWELHPLVVDPAAWGRGVGRSLLGRIEELGRERGVIGVMLGTDDDHFRTSLSSVDLDGSNALEEMARVRNTGGHPYEFYRRCGYAIVGVVPNANGPRKPDIWMWKDIRPAGA